MRNRGLAIKSLGRLISLCFMLLSVFMCVSAVQLRGGSLSIPKFMFFPFLLGLALMTISVVVFVQLRGASSFAGLFVKGEGLKIFYLLGTFSLCLILFEPAGFAISIFIFITLLLRGIGGKTARKSILYGFIISLSTYLFFSRLLGVRLPPGILGF